MNGLSPIAARARIALSGAIGLGVCLAVLAWIAAQPIDPAIDPAAAESIAAKWLVLPAVSLWAGLQFTAFWRFSHPADIEGSASTQSRPLEIALRYNRNTLEQLVLAAIAWLALASCLPARAHAIFPALASLFVLGRATFWAGYAYSASSRAFGFVVTMVPTVTALLFAGACPL